MDTNPCSQASDDSKPCSQWNKLSSKEKYLPRFDAETFVSHCTHGLVSLLERPIVRLVRSKRLAETGITRPPAGLAGIRIGLQKRCGAKEVAVDATMNAGVVMTETRCHYERVAR
jgi:hypothetical protein